MTDNNITLSYSFFWQCRNITIYRNTSLDPKALVPEGQRQAEVKSLIGYTQYVKER
jgi:hypothetical protein